MSTEHNPALAACRAIRKAEEDYGPALGGGTCVCDIITPEVDLLIDAALDGSASELDVMIDKAVLEGAAKAVRLALVLMGVFAFAAVAAAFCQAG